MIPRKRSPTEAFEAIQSLLKECNGYSTTQHARERMLERCVNDLDIRNVLTKGSVSPAEWNENHQNWKYAISGIDLDGAQLVVVVALEPQHCRITVITVQGC